MSIKRVKYVKAEDERRKGLQLDTQIASEPALQPVATEPSKKPNPTAEETLISNEPGHIVEVDFITEDEDQVLLARPKPLNQSATIAEKKETLPLNRLLGLFGSVTMAVLAFVLGLILIGSTNDPIEQSLCILALLTTLGTYTMLFWNEFSQGNSSEI